MDRDPPVHPSSLWDTGKGTTRPKEKRLPSSRDEDDDKTAEARHAKGFEKSAFDVRKKKMCFGEKDRLFVFLNPGFCVKQQHERERERERSGENAPINTSLSHGNWNEEDTDARRDKKKSERFDVWAWREYHVRVLKGKLF